jgi:hypothetical protein
MEEYITLDDYRYATNAKNWKMSILPPASPQLLLNEEFDVTFGPNTWYIFTGELVVHMAPEHYIDHESRGSLLAKTNSLILTDHYGSNYRIVAIGPFPERGISPMWESPSEIMYVSVQLKGLKIFGGD